MVVRFVSAAVAALSILAAGAAALAQTAGALPPISGSAIALRGPVATSATSQIYAPVRISTEDLARYGYEQQEYFISGRGNVYRHGEGDRLQIERADVPYTTRLLVVRPRDPRRFNGVVQMSSFHPSFGAETTWNRYGDYILSRGEAYVIVSAGGDVVSTRNNQPNAPVNGPQVLTWFDPDRYGPIQWPDDGLRWDVYAQVASLLRTGGPASPLNGYRVRRLYSSGWSFLGSFQRTFINEGFHDRTRLPDGRPVIDGYLIGISSPAVTAGYNPINGTSEPEALPVGNPHRMLRDIDVPVIELLSENEAITNAGPQAPDRDAARGGHRLYELGGVSHTDNGYAPVIGTNLEQLLARHHPGARPPVACEYAPTDVPMRDIARAALDNLNRWVETGVAPPRAARMEADYANRQALRDPYGNPRGGVRPAQLDVPLVTYGAPPNGACANPQRSYLVIKRLPLSAEQLRARYPGGRAQFLREFRARNAQLIREHWLLPEDARAQNQRAEELSRQAFAAR